MRPRSSAPCTLPRRSAERNVTFAQRRELRRGVDDRGVGLGERRAAEHHDDVAVGGQVGEELADRDADFAGQVADDGGGVRA